MSKPIGVKGHSLIDYGFFAGVLGGVTALGLFGKARVIPLAFAAGQGVLNTLTDQPYAAKRLVPFKAHGETEAVVVPALALSVLLTDALEQRRAKPFFAVLLGSLATVYALTDWDAQTKPAG